MSETIRILTATGLNFVPVITIVVMLLRKIFPGIDPYFEKGSIILAEVDDVLDGILLEYPENNALNRVNDVVENLVQQLKRAGYKVDQETEVKIENHVKGRLKREEGANVSWDGDDLKLEYNKNF
ncbi:hypothetical protein MWH28_07290 [Natroniella sulfidigena]|uniref:hypothetical protein n=1 Tax=Natroniella sulfidigena TaxID=723921 RepID=UPI00200A71BD|nr:hypothetical protein [Natroniella sulfidigena]MCK8817163.1 hypothetical protein [Natroniella sulfidigena]